MKHSLASLFFLHTFWILFAVFPSASLAVDRQPSVAVVTQEKTGFEDILLAELTSRGGIQLLERDDFWRAQGEISSAAVYKNSLQLAARLQADGLLFITGGKEKYVRLVETTRGAILAQWMFSPADGDAEQTAKRLADALISQLPRLLIPARAKIYVSMRSGAPKDSDAADSLLLSRLNALVAFKLACDPSVVLVERENFAAVWEEKKDDSGLAAPWIAADAVISIKSDRDQTNALHFTYQIQGSRVTKPQAKIFAVDYTSLEKTAESIVQFLRQTLAMASAPGPAGQIDLHGEAALYQYMAMIAETHKENSRALSLMELACLLCPKDAAWRGEFVRMAIENLHENVDDEWHISCFSEGKYMEYVHWLRQAVLFQQSLDPSSSARNLFGKIWWTYRLLARDTRQFSERDRYSISCLRAELRAFLPCVAGGHAQKFADKDIALFAAVAPAFFDDPKAAMASLRGLMTFAPFPIESLRQNIYLEMNGWDREQAGRLWVDLLSELGQSKDIAKQATSLIGLCYYHNAFDEYGSSATNRSAGVPSLKLFEWMETNPEGNKWMQEQEIAIHDLLWNALVNLSTEKQDHYYEGLMLPQLKKRPIEESCALRFLKSRFEKINTFQVGPHTGWFNIHQPQEPGVISAMQQHMRQLHETIHGSDGVSFDDWLKPLLRQEWIAIVFAKKQLSDLLLYPEIPNGQLIFDSASMPEWDAQQNRYIFDGFYGCMDGQWLWAVWGGTNELGLARIDLKAKTVRYFLVPVGAKVSADHLKPFRTVRYKNRLYIAEDSKIYIIPLQNDIPVIDSRGLQTLGPKIGDHLLGYTKLKLKDGVYQTKAERHVTALVGCGNYLYIALDYGAIYRWDGLTSPQQLAASDSLLEGPLNNCLPYTVFAAFADKTEENIYFLLDRDHDRLSNSRIFGQRNGIWQYNIKTNAWRQVLFQNFYFSKHTRGVDLMRQPGFYDFSDGMYSYRFDMAKGTLQRESFEVSTPDMTSGYSCQYFHDDRLRGQEFRYCTNREPKGLIARFREGMPLFRVDEREFHILQIAPVDDGVYILIAVLHRPGVRPKNRGLVYFIPFPYAKNGATTELGSEDTTQP